MWVNLPKSEILYIKGKNESNPLVYQCELYVFKMSEQIIFVSDDCGFQKENIVIINVVHVYYDQPKGYCFFIVQCHYLNSVKLPKTNIFSCNRKTQIFRWILSMFSSFKYWQNLNVDLIFIIFRKIMTSNWLQVIFSTKRQISRAST